MKITTDTNTNTDFLSITNKEDDNTSILGSLFSINFNSVELKPNNVGDDIEFVFKKDEIEIIEYLSNILPNLNFNNLNSTDLDIIKNKIKSDQSIKTELKDKILIFLDLAKNHNKNIFINFPKQNKIKASNNENIEVHTSDLKIKNKGSKVSPLSIRSAEKAIESSALNKNTNRSIELEQELNTQMKYNSNNKSVNFVKKINKNNHPNKLYQLSNTNSSMFKDKSDIASLIDGKSSNSHLNFVNNQIGDELIKNKMNEIRVNDRALNMQSSFESGSKGNQFSQQNQTLLTSSNFNSVLEGLFETLDLTQKGWTSKLVSRIENALGNGGEEIEFNLKPKNLGRLKVSISLKNGTGNVKIITENTFVTSALTQNENHLQKLFNDQGIDLEFTAKDGSQYFGSKNSFKKNPNNNDQNNFIKSDAENEQKDIKNSLDENVSSRHIVNVIA